MYFFSTLWKYFTEKGIFHPKLKICCNFTLPQAIQDVGDFLSSVKQKRF